MAFRAWEDHVDIYIVSGLLFGYGLRSMEGKPSKHLCFAFSSVHSSFHPSLYLSINLSILLVKSSTICLPWGSARQTFSLTLRHLWGLGDWQVKWFWDYFSNSSASQPPQMRKWAQWLESSHSLALMQASVQLQKDWVSPNCSSIATLLIQSYKEDCIE